MTEDQITVKELLIRVEANLKEEIGNLRSDMKTFQENVVTRTEHKATTDHIYKELERLDRRVDEANTSWKESLRDFKEDLQEDHRRLLTIGGIVLVVIQLLITVSLHFI